MSFVEVRRLVNSDDVYVSSGVMSAGPCRSCMMTLQMPPDLLHYAEAATGPNASRREVRSPPHIYTPVFESPETLRASRHRQEPDMHGRASTVVVTTCQLCC